MGGGSGGVEATYKINNTKRANNRKQSRTEIALGSGGGRLSKGALAGGWKFTGNCILEAS